MNVKTMETKQIEYNKNITGQRFERLTALEPVWDAESKRMFWKCRCDCGNITTVYYWNLVKGHTRSCGCLKRHDLTGQHIGKLTVLRRSDRTDSRGKRRVVLWECRCDCGAITYKATDILTNDAQNSCAKCAAIHASKVARESAGYVGGTQISRIKDMKPTSANSSGVRGVYYEKKANKWRARLRFKGKIMDFGSYERFEDAVAARKAAEKEYFGTFLEEHELQETP